MRPGRNNADKRSELSKAISKSIRRDLRSRHNQIIGQIIEEFAGLKRICNIRNNGKRNHISSIQCKDGTVAYNKQDIADVFAEFYEDLYASRCPEGKGDLLQPSATDGGDIKRITVSEIKQQLKIMKKGKAADKAGVAIEMVQLGSETLLEVIAELFNQLLFTTCEPPDLWKQSLITVLHKKGDIRCPDNYRPITMLPILYKLFARILDSRIKFSLEKVQSVDQAGFRKGFGCEDHLFTIVQIIEKMTEYNRPLWICAIDFRKAFDSVEHHSIWKALASQGVHGTYISLLQRLYQNQVGKIILQKESRSFKLTRGTKQGDPMSPSLFNAVLEDVFGKLKTRWNREGRGLDFGQRWRLTNLRFADDVLLIAESRKHLQIMVEELLVEASAVGLEMHIGNFFYLKHWGIRAP